MSLAAVVTKIAAVIGGVADAGVVHEYHRYVANDADLRALLVSGGRLQAWMITLDPENPYETFRKPANHELSVYRFLLRRYYALDDSDASEVVHRNHVEAVIAAFRANKKLDNTVIESGPVLWKTADHRQFAGVLCHFAELRLPVLEQTEP